MKIYLVMRKGKSRAEQDWVSPDKRPATQKVGKHRDYVDLLPKECEGRQDYEGRW
ncbi:MAG: hypothetical protein MUP16_12590 [Sedimentisphaerales bacterium]|nr:hypothetical protein [Sedimentisphaerales bacterium]